MNSAIPTSTPPSPAKTSETPLLRVIAIGLVFGAAASLLALMDRAPWQHAEAVAQPTTAATTIAAALAPAPRAEAPRVVTASGDVTPAGVAAIVETLTNDGPVADPGGAFPRPRAGALFHRMVDAAMTLRVYTVPGSPDAVLASYTKDLEAAGFHRDDEATKPDARGRVRRVYSKKDVEALITVSRSSGEHAGQTLMTIVEEPKREAP